MNGTWETNAHSSPSVRSACPGAVALMVISGTCCGSGLAGFMWLVCQANVSHPFSGTRQYVFAFRSVVCMVRMFSVLQVVTPACFHAVCSCLVLWVVLSNGGFAFGRYCLCTRRCIVVPTGSPSCGWDAVVYVKDRNQPSLPTPFFYYVLVSISVCVALSTVFHSINSPDNSPFSHSLLPVLFLLYWSF